MAKVYSKIWKINFSRVQNPYAYASPESVNEGPVVDSDSTPTEFNFEWEAGSDLVGDCIWPWSHGQITIRKSLALDLMRKFTGMKLFEASALGVPRKKGARRKKVEPIEFAVLWPKHWLSYDEKLSTVEERVGFAGIKLPTIVGAEEYEHDYRPRDGVNRYIHIPRVPNKGLFIHIKDTLGFDIFRPRQFPGMILCTDDFRQFFVRRDITNIEFLEVGDVIG